MHLQSSRKPQNYQNRLYGVSLSVNMHLLSNVFGQR